MFNKSCNVPGHLKALLQEALFLFKFYFLIQYQVRIAS
jgi:hypothetical protein